MAHLIADNSATGATLDAALRVGRGADNDVVLDHPTVSRHHAVIECVNGEHFLKDLGSRNMTRLNGRTVRARVPLAHGDKIRFGQVRMTFTVGNDPAAAPVLEPAHSNAVPSGIVFNCVCGVRLWAKEEAVDGVVTCHKCLEKVVVPAESTNAQSGETVSGVAFSAAPETLAAPVPTGTCSICQWHTHAEEQITTCPECGLTFHTECWTENCGCSAYGCAQVNALLSMERESAAHAPTEAPPTMSREAAVAPTGVRVGHVMLAAAVTGSVLGLLMFGAVSGVTLVAALVALLRRRRSNQTKLLILAAAVSVLGGVAGAFVSTMLWLGWSPGVPS